MHAGVAALSKKYQNSQNLSEIPLLRAQVGLMEILTFGRAFWAFLTPSRQTLREIQLILAPRDGTRKYICILPSAITFAALKHVLVSYVHAGVAALG